MLIFGLRRACSARSRSFACDSGVTMPAEMITFAASSMFMSRKMTLRRGRKQTKPVGGTMPVGMNTVSRSSSPPGIMAPTSPVVSPVTKTIDHSPLEGNSISPTFWNACPGPVALTTDSKICFRAR